MPAARRQRARLASAFVVMLLVAGCAGSSDSSAPAPMASTRSSAPATVASSATVGGIPNSAAGTPSEVAAIPSLPSLPIGMGLIVHEASWQSAEVGWALGSHVCEGKPCSAVLRTIDGGATWNSVARPPVAAGPPRSGPCAPGPCVKGIRFANSLTGYAYGEAFFVTADGGASWQREEAPPIDALAADARDVLRIVRDAPRCDAGCTYRFEYADVGSKSWQPATAPNVLGGGMLLIRDRDDAYALVGKPYTRATGIVTQLLVSHDRGRSWVERPDPCAAESNTDSNARDAAVGTADGALVLLCWGIGKGHDSLRLSLDRGESFSAGAVLPKGVRVGAGHVAMVSADNIVFAGFDEEAEFKKDVGAMGGSEGAVLVRTTDRGRTFETVARAWQQDFSIEGSLAFSSPTTAVWVASNATDVWRSRDAGKSWVVGKFR